MAKNTCLDTEAHATITKKFTTIASAFDCWRCHAKKKSRRKYCWQTSRGPKIICNGCNGFLRKQQKATKQTSSSTSTTTHKRKASQSGADKPTTKVQRASGETEANQHAIDDLFAKSNKKIEKVIAKKRRKKRKAVPPANTGEPNPFTHDEDGLPIYTAKALNIGSGGGTPDCPFDCWCCF